nr:unnamed protein product [Spirometra erinaceieuropaei]
MSPEVSCSGELEDVIAPEGAVQATHAEEIQGYADHNEWKNFFSAINAVYGPLTKGTAPLLSADSSTLLTEKTQILQRWAEHFRGVLNRPSTISDVAIAHLPQVETNVDLDLPPSLQETIRAAQQFSTGKAAGSNAIPAEIFARILLNRLNNHLEEGLLPESQGHSEVLPEAPAIQLNQLGRARPRSSDLEEDSEDGRCDL